MGHTHTVLCSSHYDIRLISPLLSLYTSWNSHSTSTFGPSTSESEKNQLQNLVHHGKPIFTLHFTNISWLGAPPLGVAAIRPQPHTWRLSTSFTLTMSESTAVTSSWRQPVEAARTAIFWGFPVEHDVGWLIFWGIVKQCYNFMGGICTPSKYVLIFWGIVKPCYNFMGGIRTPSKYVLIFWGIVKPCGICTPSKYVLLFLGNSKAML